MPPLDPPIDRPLVVSRGDDLGLATAVHEAAIRAHREGFLKNVSVQCVAPRFREAAEALKRVPSLCVGLHVTITCEWANLRFEPAAGRERVPGLVDETGNFFQNVHAVPGGVDADQLVAEARAQLERFRKVGLEPSYVDFHMGAHRASEATAEAMVDFAAGEGLIHGDHFRAIPRPENDGGDVIDGYAKVLRTLPAGVYRYVRHPIADDAETRQLVLRGREAVDVVAGRLAETASLTDARLRDAAEANGVRFVRYDEVA